MSNDHLDAHFRVIFDRLTASHRAALEELRDGNAALARAAAKGPLQKDGSRMPRKIQYVRDISLSFEQPPIPMRNFDWRAMHHGDDEEPSRHGWGRTPEEALADLKRLDAVFEDSLQTETERLLEEQP